MCSFVSTYCKNSNDKVSGYLKKQQKPISKFELAFYNTNTVWITQIFSMYLKEIMKIENKTYYAFPFIFRSFYNFSIFHMFLRQLFT